MGWVLSGLLVVRSVLEDLVLWLWCVSKLRRIVGRILGGYPSLCVCVRRGG